jgi:hypothetical protein
MSAQSFLIIWQQAHRVHFHIDNNNHVKYVDSGVMCHPILPHYKSIKKSLTPHFLSSINSLAMMSIVLSPSS